jgi:2-haloacid dehalogenase
VRAIDAAVFDLGGVLLDWDPRHLYREVFDDEAEVERFLTEVCTLEWHFQHDAGTPFEETIPALAAKHPEYAEAIAMWETRYVDMVAGEVPGTADVLRSLDDLGVALYALTNMPAEVVVDIVDYDWVRLFRGVVVSGVELVTKPDPAIYRVLLDRYGLDPARTLFVDDRADNVDAAARLGFRAVRFTDAETLRREVDRLLRG